MGLAQDCELPSPSDLHVVNTTPSSVELAWTEVPGAMEYQVETVEAATGIPVAILATTDNTIVVTGLQPETAYTTTVTTICENSEPGGSSSTDFINNVIIVDVVMSFGCGPGQVGTTRSTIGKVDYMMNDGDKIIFWGHLTSQSSQNFVLGFLRDGNNLLVGTPTNTYFTSLIIDPGNGSDNASVILDNSRAGTLLNTFEPTLYPINDLIELEIDWANSVNFYATTCTTLSKGEGGNNNDSANNDDTITVNLSPNPTTNWFVLESTNDSPLIITNLNGEAYYEGLLIGSEPHEVDCSSWPNGTYIVQTMDEAGTPINTILVKTE